MNKSQLILESAHRLKLIQKENKKKPAKMKPIAEAITMPTLPGIQKDDWKTADVNDGAWDADEFNQIASALNTKKFVFTTSEDSADSEKFTNELEKLAKTGKKAAKKDPDLEQVYLVTIDSKTAAIIYDGPVAVIAFAK